MFVGPKSVGLLVSVVVVLHGNFVWSEPQYCDIESCSSGQHTLCLYPDAGPGPRCQGYYEFPLTTEEKDHILYKHNDYRQIAAQGQANEGKNGLLPSASNMRELKWDDKLEQIAQRWADQCTDGHDACRDLQWWRERRYFDKNDVSRFPPNDSYSNYTQIMWATTSHFACARAVYKVGKKLCVNLICNYAPAGNQENEPVYEIGSPASACPNGPGTVQGLCA